MCYKWGNKSFQVRKSLHPNLRLLCDLTLRKYDISLISGLREEEEQNSYYDQGTSKVRWPNSFHNKTKDPSLEEMSFLLSDAVDLIPADTGYESKERFNEVAQHMKAWALVLGIELEWGGDFNTFYDGAHFQLRH